MKFRVLTGTAKDVESAINELEIHFWIKVVGISTTNETTTVVIEIMSER